MMRNPLAGALLMAAACVAPLRAQASDASLAARVDSVASQVLESTGVPSASVAVVRHGKLAYAQAYGAATLEPKKPATPAMRYAIGSISKQFTAASILLLQQEGKLSVDDPVGKYVPGLTQGDQVTIREVLSHTSGYQDFWAQDYVMPMMLKPIEPQAILDRWAKKPLDFAPGSRWQYSNTNYTIAGMIVEKVSGMPVFQFVKQHILDPLGMKSATDFDAKGDAAVDVTPYVRYALGPLHPAPEAGSGWMWAAGELSMTPSDLAKWDVSMIDQSLLAPKSYRELETEVQLNSGVGTGYGLGVDVGMLSGHRLISHTGEVSGFTAYNGVFPDDSAAVVVLTNQDAAPAASAIGQQVGRLLFATQDAQTQARTARALKIFEGLQHGMVDRSLLTSDLNAYFSDVALGDFASSLGPLGTPTSFVQVAEQGRGGMLERVYRVTFPDRTLRVWTYEMPDGTLEQYQVAPQG